MQTNLLNGMGFGRSGQGNRRGRRDRATARAVHVEGLEARRLFSSGFTTLAAFGSAPQGVLPQSTLSVDGSGNLYGDASAGGASNDGTVFEVAHGSSTITTLASFDGSNGQTPEGGVIIDGNGDLFGTTNAGGANGDGAVFEVVNGSNAITTLASFDETDGANPNTGLILDGSGNLFGTTTSGGAASDGTVFEIVHGSNAITALASFDGTDGSEPAGSLAVDGNGNLFGATSAGGTDGYGVVFELAKGGSTIAALASFDGTNGQAPVSGVVIVGSGNLFGLADRGGANNVGDVFELASGSSTITALASFDTTDGEFPRSSLSIDSDGNLFGAASAGGANDEGDAFEVVQNSNAITVLASFNFTNGALPQAGPILSGGNLFGATDEGGVDGVGAIYEVAQGSNAITSVASFAEAPSGPAGSLVRDASGNLFGTASGGDTGNSGAVFEIASGSNTIDTVASFDGANGESPKGGLIEDGSGDLFGTTGGGGTDDDGTVFEVVDGTNTITTLGSFDGANGSDAQASSLVLDGNGNLYGTTANGGSHDDGTVFEIVNGSNTITTLASFSGSNGANPFDGVILDSQGNLFGTAESGGAGGLGDVFEIVKGSGTITALASFDGANGEGPSSDLAIDSDGNLYGTTQFGGATDNNGSVFEVVNGSHTITTLASFNGVDGQQPEGSLTLGAAGDLYGTTEFGGAGNNGTVFEIVKGSGAVSTLYSFTGLADGANPLGGVTLDGSGDVFGAASSGGVFGGGTVFEMGPVSTRLVFQGQLSNVAAGANIAPVVTVEIENQAGQVVTSDNSQVSLSIATGPNGAVLNQTVAAVNGVATFSGITLDMAGAYTFTATDGTDISANSNTFNVSPDAATQLVFVGQPTNITAGNTFSSNIVVDAEDQFGNLDPTSSANVTLAVNIAPTGGSFAPITIAAVNGVATFSSIPAFDVAGEYSLAATHAGILSGTSSEFDVLPAAASQLVFVSQPVNITAGNPSGSTFVVNVDDPYGNLDTNYNSSVTLGATGGPPGASFTPITVTAVNGVATFSGVSLETAGTYTFTVTDANGVAANSNAITVAPYVPAALFVFVTQPSNLITAGNTFSTTIVVDAEDQSGNFDPDYDSTVTLGVKIIPTGVSFTAISVQAINGVATFSTVPPFDAAGGYKLKATQPGILPAKSNKFFIVPGATSRFGFASQPTNITAGSTLPSSIVVDAEDQFGNFTANYNSDVTLGVKIVPIGGSFTPITADAIDGVVTFSTIPAFDLAGGYKLKATQSGMLPGKSNKFFVAPATAQGPLAIPAVSPAVAVGADDVLGNVGATDLSDLANFNDLPLATTARQQSQYTGGSR